MPTSFSSLFITLDGRVVPPVSNTYSTSTEHRSNAQKLLDMGFDSVAVEQALDLCHQNIEKAVHLLTTGELLDDLEMDGSQSSVEQHIILRFILINTCIADIICNQGSSSKTGFPRSKSSVDC